jgi:HPt (histidine-containing phosphotransfer) domain-containing protein
MQTPTLDQAKLDKLRADLGDEAVVTLVRMFAERSSDVDEMVSASRRGDAELLARLAHSLRGGAAIFAAPRLAELSAKLEQHAVGESLADAVPIAAEAATEFDRVLAAIGKALGTPGLTNDSLGSAT